MKFKFIHLLFIILILCLFFFKTNCDCIEPFDLVDIPMYRLYIDNYNQYSSSFRGKITSNLFNIRSTKQVFKNPHNAYPEYLRRLEEGFNKRTDDYGYYVARGSRAITPSPLTGEEEYIPNEINLFCVNQNRNIIEYRSAISLDDLDTYFVENIPKISEVYTNRQIAAVDTSQAFDWTIEHTSLIRLYPIHRSGNSHAKDYIFSIGKDHDDSNMIIIFGYKVDAQGGNSNIDVSAQDGGLQSLDDSGVWAITQKIRYYH